MSGVTLTARELRVIALNQKRQATLKQKDEARALLYAPLTPAPAGSPPVVPLTPLQVDQLKDTIRDLDRALDKYDYEEMSLDLQYNNEQLQTQLQQAIALISPSKPSSGDSKVDPPLGFSPPPRQEVPLPRNDDSKVPSDDEKKTPPVFDSSPIPGPNFTPNGTSYMLAPQEPLEKFTSPPADLKIPKATDDLFTTSRIDSNRFTQWLTKKVEDSIRSNPRTRILLSPFNEVWSFYVKSHPRHIQLSQHDTIAQFIVSESNFVFSQIIAALPETYGKSLTSWSEHSETQKFKKMFSDTAESSFINLSGSFYDKDHCYIHGFLNHLRKTYGADPRSRLENATSLLETFKFKKLVSVLQNINDFNTLLYRYETASKAFSSDYKSMSDYDKKRKLFLKLKDDHSRFQMSIITYQDRILGSKASLDLQTYEEFTASLIATYPASADSAVKAKQSNSPNTSKPKPVGQPSKAPASDQPVAAVSNSNSNQNSNNNNNRGRRRNRSRSQSSDGKQQSYSSAVSNNNANHSNNQSQPKSILKNAKEVQFNDPIASATSVVLAFTESTNQVQVQDTLFKTNNQLSRRSLLIDSGAASHIAVGKDVCVSGSIKRSFPQSFKTYNGGTFTTHYAGDIEITDKISAGNARINERADYNILSVGALTKPGKYITVFTEAHAFVIPIANLPENVFKNHILNVKNHLLTFNRVGNVYAYNIPEVEVPAPSKSLYIEPEVKDDRPSTVVRPINPKGPIPKKQNASSSAPPAASSAPSAAPSAAPASAFLSTNPYHVDSDAELEYDNDNDSDINAIIEIANPIVDDVNSDVISTSDVSVQVNFNSSFADDWHSRLGHPGSAALKRINDYYGLNLSKRYIRESSLTCITCLTAKQHRTPITGPILYPESKPSSLLTNSNRIDPAETRAIIEQVLPYPELMDLIVADLFGPLSFKEGPTIFRAPTLNENNIALLVLEVHSGHTKVVGLPNKKAETVFAEVVSFIEECQRLTGRPLKNFHSDGGTEFVNQLLNQYCSSHGIHKTWSPPGTPQRNPYAERRIQSIVTSARAMAVHSSCSPFLWDEAVSYASYIYDRIPSSRLPDKTPLEIITNKKPSLRLIHVFGSDCRAIDVLDQSPPGKLQPRGFLAIFLGIDTSRSCPRVLCVDSSLTRSYKIVALRDVIFEENRFSLMASHKDFIEERAAWINADPSKLYEVERILSQDGDQYLVQWKGWRLPTWEHKDNLKNCSAIIKEFIKSKSKQKKSPIAAITHVDSSKPLDAILLPHALDIISSLTTDFTDSFGDVTPGSFKLAQKLPDWHLWKASAEEELAALIKMETFYEDSLPPGRKALGTRWVFKLKRDKNNKIIRYKGRLVVQGYQQREGIDYKEVFSPTPRMKSIKMILSLVASGNWELKQLDFENAFLHADLKEDIYIKLPEGYQLINTSLPHPVLKLKKSLYGLKQAPREWYLALNDFLLQSGFKLINEDDCIWFLNVFDEHKNPLGQIILSTYVDDTIAAFPSNLTNYWNDFKQQLKQHFRIKDLGDCNWILNIELVRNRDSHILTLSQKAYIENIVLRYSVDPKQFIIRGAEYPSTPYWRDDITVCPPNVIAQPLSPSDHSLYRKIIGSVLYAANMTRYDIVHLVGILSRFLASPMNYHLTAAQYLLRYLAGKPDLPLKLGLSSSMLATHRPLPNEFPPLEILLWSDSDYALERIDYVSVSGLLVTLNGLPAWWESRKQSQLAQSSTEAELYAINAAAREASFIRRWIKSVFGFSLVLDIRGDNQGSLLISKHTTSHARTKHIDIKALWVRQELDRGNITVTFVPTEQQLADLLTKSFPTTKRVKYLNLLSKYFNGLT